MSAVLALVREPPTPPPDDDDILMARIARDDAASFRVLIERHERAIVRFIAKMVGSADAQDLAQDVFVRAWHARRRYRAEGAFRPWLYRLAKNRALTHLRWRKVRALWAWTQAPLVDHVPALVRDDDWRRAEPALLAMKPLWRQVFVLRFVEELEYADIARVVGVREDYARKIAQRALVWLRDELERRGVTP